MQHFTTVNITCSVELNPGFRAWLADVLCLRFTSKPKTIFKKVFWIQIHWTVLFIVAVLFFHKQNKYLSVVRVTFVGMKYGCFLSCLMVQRKYSLSEPPFHKGFTHVSMPRLKEKNYRSTAFKLGFVWPCKCIARKFILCLIEVLFCFCWVCSWMWNKVASVI